MKNLDDTIAAIATPPGVGAIGIIRISGRNCIEKINHLFKGTDLNKAKSHTIHYGYIEDNNNVLDEVMVSIFRAPRSFTTEDSIEISCHGSPFILQQVLQSLLRNGVRMAAPGEFTMRAFLNGRIDLSQAEAVADLIASENKAQHEIALNQIRGGFSTELRELREQLINFTALIELELDFSEEDVEFADRTELNALIDNLTSKISHLVSSFEYGNAIKEGIPVVIAGKPNAGKSSLLNALLNEEKAIVSDIAGTTRDSIEDILTINGIKFRFIDTAGLRETSDTIEAIGVKKAKEKVAQAKILLYLFDRNDTTPEEVISTTKALSREDLIIILLENKIDLQGGFFENEFTTEIKNALFDSGYTQSYQAISAKDKQSVESVKHNLLHHVEELKVNTDTIVTNQRHKSSLDQALKSLLVVKQGLADNISGDFLSVDIKEALKHLGEITGDIDVDNDILGTIFGKFCIGK